VDFHYRKRSPASAVSDSLVGHRSPSDPAVQSFSERDGLTSNFSFKAIGTEGSIWIATTRGIDQFRKSVLTPVNLPQGAATYIALVADAAGRLLVGSDSSCVSQMDRQK